MKGASLETAHTKYARARASLFVENEILPLRFTLEK